MKLFTPMLKILGALATAGALVSPAHAEVYTVEYTAAVDYIWAPIVGDYGYLSEIEVNGTLFRLGDILTAYVTVDTAVPPIYYNASPGGSYTEYIASNLRLYHDISGPVFSMPTPHIGMNDGDPNYIRDDFTIWGVLEPASVSIQYSGWSSTVLNGNAVAQILNQQDGWVMTYGWRTDSGQVISIAGDWTSRVSAVPEPSFFLMIASGLLLVGGMVARRC